jgi:hypothetical protein
MSPGLDMCFEIPAEAELPDQVLRSCTYPCMHACEEEQVTS